MTKAKPTRHATPASNGKKDEHKGDKNKIATFAEAVAVIRLHDESLHRHSARADALRINRGQLLAGDHAYEIDAGHFGELCGAAAAPAAYLKRLGEPYTSYLLSRQFARGDHLKALHAQRLLGRTARHRGEVTVLSRNGNFIGFSRPDLQTLRASDVLHAITKAAQKEFKDKFDKFILKEVHIDDHAFTMDLVIEASHTEIRVNDIVNGGFHIAHSFLGSHATRIDTYIHRKICSNGAVKRECLETEAGCAARIRRHTTNNPDAVDRSLNQIEHYAMRLAHGLQAKVAAIPQLVEQPVTNVRQFVERQLQQVPRLHSKRLADRIVDAFERARQHGVWRLQCDDVGCDAHCQHRYASQRPPRIGSTERHSRDQSTPYLPTLLPSAGGGISPTRSIRTSTLHRC